MSEAPIDIRGFKGLNLREPPGMIQDDELADCVNLNIGRAGELTKRTGFSLLHGGSTLSGNVHLLEHYNNGDDSVLFAKADSDKLYYSSNGASWTQYMVGVSDAEWAVQYTNKLYLINSGNPVVEIDGLSSAPNTITDSPSGTYGTVYKDRLFTLNSEDSDHPSRLYFSTPGDLTDWPSTNFIDVSPGDGDFLVACAVIHDLLIVFKTQTTWALYVQGSPENWILRNINPEIGCISKYTPREIEGFLFFVGIRGIYRTDGNIFEDISESIEPIFRQRVVNQTTANIDAGSWWEDRYIVLLHPDPSTYRYMVYHLRTEGWTEWEPANGIRPSYFLEVNTASPSKGLYAGNRDGDGRVYRHGDGAFTDAGDHFSCRFKTKDFDFSLPSLMKRGKWMGIDLDAGGQITMTHTVDGEELEDSTFQGLSERKMFKLPGPGYFRIWSLELKQNSNSDFTFYVATIWMHRKRSVIKAYT